MNKLIAGFIATSQIVFVVATLVIIFVTLSYFLDGGSHLVALAWIAIAMGCLGNISNWRKP